MCKSLIDGSIIKLVVLRNQKKGAVNQNQHFSMPRSAVQEMLELNRLNYYQMAHCLENITSKDFLRRLCVICASVGTANCLLPEKSAQIVQN